MAKRPNYKKQCNELQRQIAAALAGQQAMQRRLDAANVECEATKNWRARVSADADASTVRHVQERKELQAKLDAANARIKTLECEAIGLKADRVMGELYRSRSRNNPEQPEVENYDAAMHALRATPFGYVACIAIVNAIRAYLNPRSQSDPSVGELSYGRESSPGVAPSRDR